MEDEKIINVESVETVPTVKKQKDPKKVAAGKALAMKNAEARKAKKDYSSPASTDSTSDETSLSFFDDIQIVAGLVGAGFTLYHGWKFFSSSRGESLASQRDVQSEQSVKEPHAPQRVEQDVQSESTTTPEPKSNMMGRMD